MRSQFVAFGAGILSMIAAPAHSQEIMPIIGNWVGKGVSCKVLNDYTDERLMKIRNNSVEFYESSCNIRGSRKSGSSISINLFCEGEGETWRKVLVVDLINTNEIKVRGGYSYVRCR